VSLIVVGLVVGIVVAVHGSGSSGPAPFGSPLPAASPGASPAASPSASSAGGTVLAPISPSVTGQAIDGIQCLGGEQLLFHIHAHLAVYVDGSARTVPEGIGIMPPRQETQSGGQPFVTGGSCYYWLHAHTPDGIIHIESPVQRTFTLGNYFDIWGIPLDSTHVGPASGTVVAYVNGQVFSGDIRSIPLEAHSLIQLDVNGNVPPAPFTFPAGL
jgi:hypothetical protein